MTHTDMTKPFSSNPKLEDWVPSEQQIQTITATRELWDLVPEEEGDDLNLFKICLLYTSPSPRDVEESRMPSSA